MTSGDYDGDGRVDLAVPRPPWYVSIHHGKGNLQFEGPRDYLNPANELVITDFNGDGRADVVAVNSSTLTVGLGNADGSLAPVGSIGVVGASTAAVADFNGDGELDVFTVQGALPRLNGLFDVGAVVPPPQNLRDLRRAVASDLNGDGRMDVAALDNSSSPPAEIVTLIGDGTGKFTIAVVPTVHKPVAIGVADLNGDGRPDILTSGAEPDGRHTVRLMTGGHSVIVADPVIAGNRAAKTLAIGDVDGDGKLDFVTPSASRRELLLFPGNGNGTFASPQRIPIEGPRFIEVLSELSGVTLAEMTGDGRLDLIVSGESFVVAAFESDNTSILAQQPDGTFTEVSRLQYGDRRGSAAGDVNGDGSADLIVPGLTAMIVHISACRDALRANPPVVRLLVSPQSPERSTVVFSAVLDTPEAGGSILLIDRDRENDDGTSIIVGTAPVVAGRATIVANTLARGTHQLKAVYSGDGRFARAISGMVEHEVTEPPPAGPRRRSARH